VLPLANLSGDPQQDYLVDGMTDALTANLSQLAALKVVSRNSTMRFKSSDRPLPEIAAALGVDVVLEGSVLREGDRVAVSAQLTAADRDLSLWSRRYEREMTSVLALQGEVARAIAGEIAGELSAEQVERLRGDDDVNLRTYEAYLRGMHELSKRTPEGNREGIRQLQAAVDADPTDPRAYAGLATGYIRIGHGEGPSDVAFPRARAAALRALELDPDQAEAHAALADAYMYHEYDWPAARASFERAIELSPSLAEAHAHYTWWYVLQGRWDEAEREAALAVEYDPLSVTYTVWHAGLLWYMNRYDEGLVLVDRALELHPDHPFGEYVRGRFLRELGRWDEAIAIHERLYERLPPMGWAMAITYALAGRSDDARRVRDSYDHAASPEATYYAARISARLGEPDEAFRLLEVAYQGRSRSIPWVGVDPHFLTLWEDPRFANLLRRLDLPRGRVTLPDSASH